MSKEFEKEESAKSISSRLGINQKTDKTVFEDLTNNDGSEDPGSELDTVFSHNKNKDKNTANFLESNRTESKIDESAASKQISGIPPKGEELDAFTNNASEKKQPEKKRPKPQADQILNSGLNSENDI